MIKYALVGNIASGKSTVEEIIKQNNYPVLDTDKVCHRLLTETEQIKETFKEYNVFLQNGEISREKLGQLVFNNTEEKKKLENILYPIVRIEIEKFFQENKDKKAAFVAIPLLFEAQMEDLFDKILFIYCDDKIRLERLIKRNNYNIEYAQKRLSSQQSQEEKITKSDIVINNNSDKKALEQEIQRFLKNI